MKLREGKGERRGSMLVRPQVVVVKSEADQVKGAGAEGKEGIIVIVVVTRQ